MNLEEFQNQVTNLENRRRMNADRVCQVARQILPVLKDHNLNNCALALEAELFTLDATFEEIKELLLANPESVADVLLGRKPGSGHQ